MYYLTGPADDIAADYNEDYSFNINDEKVDLPIFSQSGFDDDDYEASRSQHYCEQKDLKEVLREWISYPETLGMSRALLDKLCDLFQKYKPTFNAEDLKKFPKTGKGL